jgi:protein-disulfide isomerase
MEGHVKLWTMRLSLGLVLACFLSAPLLLAQQQPPSDDLKKDIEALKESVKSIQTDVREIKALLQKGQPTPPSQNVDLDLGKSPFKGQRTAKLTLVEFSDYQ